MTKQHLSTYSYTFMLQNYSISGQFGDLGQEYICSIMLQGHNDKPVTKKMDWIMSVALKRKQIGSPLTDVPGAAISPPWDFPPKVLGAFLQVPWEKGSIEQRHVQVTM